jgi:hypothetical protein
MRPATHANRNPSDNLAVYQSTVNCTGPLRGSTCNTHYNGLVLELACSYGSVCQLICGNSVTQYASVSNLQRGYGVIVDFSRLNGVVRQLSLCNSEQSKLCSSNCLICELQFTYWLRS